MGAYDGAEKTDIVGLYILEKLEKVAPRISFGLYRDDGLGVHGRITAKDLHQMFFIYRFSNLDLMFYLLSIF